MLSIIPPFSTNSERINIVKTKFDEVGLGTECKIGYVNPDNSDDIKTPVGILKSYNMDTLKCQLTINGKDVEYDMRYVVKIFAYDDEEKMKDEVEARQIARNQAEKDKKEADKKREAEETERAQAEFNKAWQKKNARTYRLEELRRSSFEIYQRLNAGASEPFDDRSLQQFNNITLEDLDYFKSKGWDAGLIMLSLERAESQAKQNLPLTIDEKTLQICKRLADPDESYINPDAFH